VEKILIFGAGGHAQVVADILICMTKYHTDLMPIGYLDDDLQLLGNIYLGLPVLGKTDRVAEIDHDRVIIAIGNNARRKQLFESLKAQGKKFFTAIHPTAIISPFAKIGVGTTICAGAIVNPTASIGNNVILNTGSTVDHHNQIEDHVHIAPGVNLGGAVKVNEGAFIGIGAKVIPEREIGAWSTVGAGATIVTDVESKSMYLGTPGRIRQSI
jgi:sugar O-acyltransferase (sialic acid O-acetyltransferase NeuD family)